MWYRNILKHNLRACTSAQSWSRFPGDPGDLKPRSRWSRLTPWSWRCFNCLKLPLCCLPLLCRWPPPLCNPWGPSEPPPRQLLAEQQVHHKQITIKVNNLMVPNVFPPSYHCLIKVEKISELNRSPGLVISWCPTQSRYWIRWAGAKVGKGRLEKAEQVVEAASWRWRE